MRRTIPQSRIPRGRPALAKNTGNGGRKTRSKQGRESGFHSTDFSLTSSLLAGENSFSHHLFLTQIRNGLRICMNVPEDRKGTSMTAMGPCQCRSSASIELGRTPVLPLCCSFQPPNQREAGSVICQCVKCGLLKTLQMFLAVTQRTTAKSRSSRPKWSEKFRRLLLELKPF